MGWQERRYEPGGGDGKFRAVLRRVFGDGENPMDWALPLYTAWGIRVRVHLFFVMMVIAELARAAAPNGFGIWQRAIGMTSLFVIVLLHEYGHCIACRRVGGTANQILLWPLGGLAYCATPPNWKANLITTLGGPAVNVLLIPVFAGALLLLGQGWSSVLFNPLTPELASASLHASDNTMLRVVWWVWWLHYTNTIILLFNMLLPMYPMDGARTLLAILWRSMGENRATWIVIRVGWFTALALGIYALSIENTRLLGLAIFGGIECFMAKRRLAMVADHPALAGYDFSRGYQGLPDEEDDAANEKKRAKRLKQEQEEQQELDRILAKIASTGMGSLTRAEKKWLEQASARRRGA